MTNQDLALWLEQQALAFQAKASTLKAQLSFAEKVRRICRKLGGKKPGTGKTARLIGVDPSTIIHWRKRPDDWHPAPKHESKVDEVYKKLLGEGC